MKCVCQLCLSNSGVLTFMLDYNLYCNRVVKPLSLIKFFFCSLFKEGIGTDATMHDHIKKLLDRFYATKDANTRFTPTNLVMGLDFVQQYFFFSLPYDPFISKCDLYRIVHS